MPFERHAVGVRLAGDTVRVPAVPDPVLVGALRLDEDVQIVVRSTWRYIQGESDLRLLLGPLGKRVVGVTSPGAF